MDLWVFDNDGTLYDDFGADEKFMKILFQYASTLLGIPVEDVPAEIKKLKDKWHTEFSILALMREYSIDFSEMVQNTYLKITLDECGIIAPDIMRFDVLSSIDSHKVVFTNNPSVFAQRVLSYVGLKTCFADFIGIEETNFCEKPNHRAYKVVEGRHGGFNRIIFCDDSLNNLETARRMGWTTIWCKPKNLNVEMGRGHIVISSFKELKTIL